MSLDRKQLACYVVGAETSAGQWRWCALNEDCEWLAALDQARSEQAEKVGVVCCNPSERVRAAALSALEIVDPAKIVAYKLFQSTDSDECAGVLSRRVMN